MWNKKRKQKKNLNRHNDTTAEHKESKSRRETCDDKMYVDAVIIKKTYSHFSAAKAPKKHCKTTAHINTVTFII